MWHRYLRMKQLLKVCPQAGTQLCLAPSSPRELAGREQGTPQGSVPESPQAGNMGSSTGLVELKMEEAGVPGGLEREPWVLQLWP